MTPEERFWTRVVGDLATGCWLWTGPRFREGYGSLSYGPLRIRAHRFSWELHVGPIPEGLVVCHRCDNPPCVRPDHLFLGTQSDNLHDAVAKGRPIGRQTWTPEQNARYEAARQRRVIQQALAAFRRNS